MTNTAKAHCNYKFFKEICHHFINTQYKRLKSVRWPKAILKNCTRIGYLGPETVLMPMTYAKMGE